MGNEDIKNFKGKEIDENIIIMYARLGAYFSLSEEERPKYRNDLMLPDIAKDLTDKELFAVYKYLGHYLSAIATVEEAVNEITSLPIEQAERVKNVIVEIFKGTLGTALDLYNTLSKNDA